MTLPAPFVARTRALLAADAEFDSLLAALGERPLRALRVNPAKATLGEVCELLGISIDLVPWCPDATYLSDGGRVGRHPAHAAGLYYLQEPSAMAVVEALDVQPGHRVLDLAAAPGGKSTHIASRLGAGGLLVANEVERGRLHSLAANLDRWGYPNVAISNDTVGHLEAAWGPGFDRVLLDAPCSGEGMFRKDEAARQEWSPGHVRGCAARQARLLTEAAGLVRPGGLLVYSTCTFAPEENEQRVVEFLDASPGWEVFDVASRLGVDRGRPEWADGRRDVLACARLWPHRQRGEGHFVAALLRTADRADQHWPDRARAPRRREWPEAVAGWDQFSHRFLGEPFAAEHVVAVGDTAYLVPTGVDPTSPVRWFRPGLPLGRARPGRFEPSHALAFALPPSSAPAREAVDDDETAAYLRGGEIRRAGPPGWVLVLYRRWPLGWAHRAGDRLKSRYPKGLRLQGGCG